MAFSASAAAPALNVGSLVDYLPPTSSNILKRIRNSGDATAYVRVDVLKITYGADGQAAETPVDSAALTANTTGASGLIASPSRMIIASKGQQATRLVYRGDREQEQYYRLRFLPVVPDAKEFSLSEEQVQQAQTVNASVQVLTGYGTILIIAPKAPRYDTRISGRQIHNGGNATVVLNDLQHCKILRPYDCSEGMLIHVRPGTSYTLEVPEGHFTRYEINEGGQRRKLESR